ncbi:MAG: dTDP-4-dehydrorhamnose reductase [Leptospiraceae bacterium]|nr:dTDP-4-dehydrorhamnose reductase [Leptospiraceae bacterium]
MKNILVTGADGQLGNELQILAKSIANYSFIFTDKDTLDITNLKNLYDYIKNQEISVIINTAAYTNVEKAEEEKEFAYNVNVIGSKNLAQISKEFNLRLIHISTDYVFDGKKSESYLEEDTKNPLSVYGKTKSEGEGAILETYSNAVIIRTSWVYSYFGKNFFKTIVNLASKQKEIKIVSDQIGTPTWAKSLAETTLKLIDHSFTGILHYSNEGVTSWYVCLCNSK